MDLLSNYEKLLLFILVAISIVILVANFILVRSNQKKLDFLHPGWLLNILVAFYGITTPIYLLFNSDDYINMNRIFINLYSFNNFVLIFGLFILILFMFLISEVYLLLRLRSQSKDFDGKELTLKGWKLQSFNLSITILLTLLTTLLIYNFNLIGGFHSDLLIDKVSRYEEFSNRAQILPFTPFYQVVFLYWFYYLVKYNFWNLRRKFIYWISFLIFTFFVLLMGTSLQILLVAIGKIFIIYVYQRGYIIKNKRKIIFSLVILAVLFIGFQNYRDILMDSSGEVTLKQLIKFPDLTRFETITGYISGFVLLADENIINNFNAVQTIVSFLPGSIINLFSEQSVNLTELINNSSYNPSYGSYTVTLPMSLYALFNIVGVLLFSITFYILSFYIISFLFKGGHYFKYLSIVLYCNLFYLVRIDTISWFGKVRLDVFLAIIIIFISWLIYQVFKEYVYKTRGYKYYYLRGDRK